MPTASLACLRNILAFLAYTISFEASHLQSYSLALSVQLRIAMGGRQLEFAEELKSEGLQPFQGKKTHEKEIEQISVKR